LGKDLHTYVDAYLVQAWDELGELEGARRGASRRAAPPENAVHVIYPPVVVGRFCPGLAHTPYHITRYVGS